MRGTVGVHSSFFFFFFYRGALLLLALNLVLLLGAGPFRESEPERRAAMSAFPHPLPFLCLTQTERACL